MATMYNAIMGQSRITEMKRRLFQLIALALLIILYGESLLPVVCPQWESLPFWHDHIVFGSAHPDEDLHIHEATEEAALRRLCLAVGTASFPTTNGTHSRANLAQLGIVFALYGRSASDEHLLSAASHPQLVAGSARWPVPAGFVWPVVIPSLIFADPFLAPPDQPPRLSAAFLSL